LKRAVLIFLIVAGVGFRAWMFNRLPRDLSVCTADFAAFYAGGKLAGTTAIYSPAAVFAAEQQAMGCHMENIIFIKPPFYAWLMWPFAQLPFMTAIALWRALGLAAIGLFLWMWPGSKLVAAAACAWSLPLAANFNAGQDVAFVLAAAMGAACLLKAGRPFGAGLALGACAIKFHLFSLLPLLVWERRLWRTLVGGVAVVAMLAAVSFARFGPSWPRQYWTALQDPRMNPYPWNMINLNGLFHYHTFWVIPAAVVVASLCWYIIAAAGVDLAMAALLAGGVLITPHNTIADGVLFLPLLLLAQKSRSVLARALALFGLTPVPGLLPGAWQVIVVLLLAGTAYELWQPRSLQPL
jgi:hypothetical protein